jgi:hypothetical protein
MLLVVFIEYVIKPLLKLNNYFSNRIIHLNGLNKKILEENKKNRNQIKLNVEKKKK